MEKHLGRLGTRNDFQCPRCGEHEETSFNLITHCVSAEELRGRILGASFLNAEPDLEDIGMNRLLNFARKADLPHCPA